MSEFKSAILDPRKKKKKKQVIILEILYETHQGSSN